MVANPSELSLNVSKLESLLFGSWLLSVRVSCRIFLFNMRDVLVDHWLYASVGLYRHTHTYIYGTCLRLGGRLGCANQTNICTVEFEVPEDSSRIQI